MKHHVKRLLKKSTWKKLISPRKIAGKEETEAEKPLKTNFVEKKQIPKLTAEERALIFKDHIDGVDQPFYQVKQFKNVNFTIIKRKEQKQTVAEKAVRTKPPPPKEPTKEYYSDNQLLFEHIIELNAKFDKLLSKHKKLKKRYENLHHDIYEYEFENEHEEIPHETHQDIQQEQPEIRYSKQQLNTQRGCRSRLTYL